MADPIGESNGTVHFNFSISMHALKLSALAFALGIGFLFGEAQAADQKYRVKKGDNLSKIGRIYGIHYREIMAANGLRSTIIYPNQILVIPARPPASRTEAPPPPLASAPSRPTTPGDRVGAPPSPPRNTPQATPPRSPIQPIDPVEQPFAEAKPLRPRPGEEDPLGLGYQPKSSSTSPFRNPPAASDQPSAPHSPRPSVTRRPRAVREVPAVAHYPEGPPAASRSFALDPDKFPTPSFSEARRGRSVPAQRVHTVQHGDSVWTISRKFGVSPLKLRRANGLGLSRIRPGMKLQIP